MLAGGNARVLDNSGVARAGNSVVEFYYLIIAQSGSAERSTVQVGHLDRRSLRIVHQPFARIRRRRSRLWRVLLVVDLSGRNCAQDMALLIDHVVLVLSVSNVDSRHLKELAGIAAITRNLCFTS